MLRNKISEHALNFHLISAVPTLRDIEALLKNGNIRLLRLSTVLIVPQLLCTLQFPNSSVNASYERQLSFKRCVG